MFGNHFRAALIFLAVLGFASPASPLSREDRAEQIRIDTEFNFFLDEGLSHMINGKNYPSALESFEKALEIKPNDPSAKKALRLARSKMKNPPPAYIRKKMPEPKKEMEDVHVSTQSLGWVNFEESSESRDNQKIRADAHYQTGVRAFLAEDYALAAKQMEAVLKLDPSHAKARKVLMKTYSLTK